MFDKNHRTVYTLNCILNETPISSNSIDCEETQIKKEIDRLLKEGFAVRVGATCIGHTLSEMVESAGAKYIRKNYDVEEDRDYWMYFKLKQNTR